MYPASRKEAEMYSESGTDAGQNPYGDLDGQNIALLSMSKLVISSVRTASVFSFFFARKEAQESSVCSCRDRKTPEVISTAKLKSWRRGRKRFRPY